MRIPKKIRDAATRRAQAVGQRDALVAEVKELDHTVTAWLGTTDARKFKFETDDLTISGTYVQSESQYLDTDRLRELIGSDLYESMTTTVVEFDQDKLRAAIKDGRVTEAQVAAAMTVKHNAPFTRYTTKAKGTT